MRRTMECDDFPAVEIICGALVYIEQADPDGGKALIVMEPERAIELADAIYAGCASSIRKGKDQADG